MRGDLDHAIKIAEAAHAGQTEKTGEPYVAHCHRVADALDTPDGKIVAWLHDVIEKGPGWSLARLANEGFTPAIIAAVDGLTERDGEDDDAFVRRAIADPLARPVKLADLRDNLRQASQAGLPTAKFKRGLAIADGL